MNPSEDVAIFWDIENVHVPRDIPGYAFVHRLRDLAHGFGTIKTFKAYMDCTKTESHRLQTDLHASGVSVIHCPHDGRKEVVDKTMLVDVITYAQDKSASATVVLITGDRDFAYAISILRFRRHRIILLPNDNASPILKHQASMTLDYQEVIGDLPRVQPSSGTSSRRSSMAARSQGSQASPRLPPSSGRADLQGLHERNSSVSTLASDADKYNGGSRGFKHSRQSSFTLHNNQGAEHGHRASFTSTATERFASPQVMPISPPASSPPRGSPSQQQSLNIRIGGSEPRSTNFSGLGTTKKNRSFPVIESSPQNPEFSEPCPWRGEPCGTTTEAPPARRKRSDTIFSSACPPSFRQLQAASTIAPETVPRPPKPSSVSPNRTSTTTKKAAGGPSIPTTATTSLNPPQVPTGGSTCSPPKQVPQRYQGLVQILERHRVQGRLRCYTDELASELSRTTNLEELMGPVKHKFKKYVRQAAKLGIVDRGDGAGSKKWVSLNPGWYGARFAIDG
ncbi:hypothetical protein BDN72DRAFT_855395 [Pluteus cervinus]|uniref:Uncharacterized protein n=1 Tax=Pluteus cervinus TaxID=181527 RepID=A0ACD3B3D5_9AGAR|nr:hypothetical protein BDN72DRAFT_855395 [Pluteus cervinus]